MDEYEQESAMLYMERLVNDAPCQDTEGNVGGSPTDCT